VYASQLWCNFRKSCMQRLRVAYNFGCIALYNLPWRVSDIAIRLSGSMVKISTFEALSGSNSCIWGPVTKIYVPVSRKMQKVSQHMVACFYVVRLFVFFPILWTLQSHFTLWISARTLQCLFDWWRVMSQRIRILPGLDQFGIWRPALQ